MLVSQSPPVFSHSPPTGFLSQNYSPLQDPFLNTIPKLQRTNSFPVKNNPSRRLLLPKRSILIVRQSEESLQEEDTSSVSKTKKKVVFADDHGMSLTQIRLMTEPSNVPPLWSKRFLAEVTQGISADPVVSKTDWEITFPQPASDYVKFRQKLEKNHVTLENIVIKETKNQIIGTIKVANLNFEKRTFVRYSIDNWQTQNDHLCVYVENSCSSSSSTYVLYDTFTFQVDLPKKSRRFEFCICYKCNDIDYWDNNDNKNYLILKKVQFLPRANTCDSFLKNIEQKDHETSKIKIDTWSEFASWTHFENSSPYW